MPHEHKIVLCNYHNADHALVAKAIDGALAAKLDWENTPFNDRAAIFLKAADLASTKYRCVKSRENLTQLQLSIQEKISGEK
jgi:1-pyrroline-5-carboxylate dehydrogenase